MKNESEESSKDAGANAEAPESPPAARQQVQVDATHALAAYTNFCRVTGTPEELIIDFGLNSQPMGIPTEAIAITQRVVLNYYTAKRLLGALQMSLQRHEAAFGVLETDVQKRVGAAPPRRQPVPAASLAER